MKHNLCFLVLVILILPVMSRAQQEKNVFPAEQQISLLLTQAERAFDSYESALQLEGQLVGGPESVAKDKETLNMARRILATLRANPVNGFNSPMGFLLVTNLDDASRNMALCMGQGGMQAAGEMQEGRVSSALKLHIAQTCLDTSVLLFTVSESALDLYAQYLSTEYKVTQQAAEELQKCAGLLKKSGTAK